MPLPTNGSFSLLGYSRPGDAILSKPKQAMIVRMTPETYEALQAFPNHPPVEFQFGSKPGIHIGKSFFSMAPGQMDQSPHEVYLRASSAAKKSPPFKLHANVVGKFTVQRELGESVGEKIRERKNEVESERASKMAILLDAPPTPTTSTKSKKKKEQPPSTASSMFRKPFASASSSSKPAESSPLLKISADSANNLRKRVIHFLATEDRTEDEVVLAVGGRTCGPSTRQLVLQVITDVADLVKKSDKTYRLKLRSWTEVRPHEWPKWSESLRTRVCAEASTKLKDLGIPESSPLWGHIATRSTATSSEVTTKTSSSSLSLRKSSNQPGEPPIKRPSASTDNRDRPYSSKASSVAQTSAQDDRPRNTSSKGLDGSRDNGKPHPSSNNERLHSGSSSRPPTTSGDSKASSRRANDLPSAREPGSSSSSKQAAKVSQRSRAYGDESNTESDIDRRSKKRTVDRDPISRLSRREKEEGEFSDASTINKRREGSRRPANDDDSDYKQSSHPQKRRKTEHSPLSVPQIKPKREESDREYRPSKANDAGHQSSRSKPIKREPSPLPPVPQKRNRPSSPLPKRPVEDYDSSRKNESARYSAHGNSSGRDRSSAKLRRKSPIYTSSEDEDSGRPQTTGLSKNHAQPSHKTGSSNGNTSQVPVSIAQPTSNTIASTTRPPTDYSRFDRKTLRSKYDTKYTEYMGSWLQVRIQTEKLRKLAKGPGSEEDDDLMGPDEFADLINEYNRKREELKALRCAYDICDAGGSSDS